MGNGCPKNSHALPAERNCNQGLLRGYSAARQSRATFIGRKSAAIAAGNALVRLRIFDEQVFVFPPVQIRVRATYMSRRCRNA
jgi:hypothetical protein